MLLDSIFILGENPAYEIKLTVCSSVNSKGRIKSPACHLNPVAITWDIQATFWEAGKYRWIHRIIKVEKDLWGPSGVELGDGPAVMGESILTRGLQFHLLTQNMKDERIWKCSAAVSPSQQFLEEWFGLAEGQRFWVFNAK